MTCNAELGQCTSSCEDECNAGDFSCDGTTLKQCTADEDGCTSWEVLETCGDAKTCNAEIGQCVQNCNNVCTPGDKQCADGGIATCITDDNGCHVWGPSSSCGNNKKCDAKTVTCVDGCENECKSGEKKCADGGMKTCGQYDNDNCTEWSAPEPCATGMKCASDGKSCVKACTDACTSGAKRCSGTGNYQTCEKKSGALCTTWSAAVSCGTGMKCENNKCVKACTKTPKGTCNDIQRISYKSGAWKSITQVNNNSFNEHAAPAIATNKKGRNVILWSDDSDANNAYDVYMRGYNSL